MAKLQIVMKMCQKRAEASVANFLNHQMLLFETVHVVQIKTLKIGSLDIIYFQIHEHSSDA